MLLFKKYWGIFFFMNTSESISCSIMRWLLVYMLKYVKWIVLVFCPWPAFYILLLPCWFFFQECLNVFLSVCFCNCIDYAANVSYQFGPSVLLFFFLFCIDIDIFLAVNSLIALIRPYGSDDVCLEMPSLRSWYKSNLAMWQLYSDVMYLIHCFK